MKNIIKSIKGSPLCHVALVIPFACTGIFVVLSQVLLTFFVKPFSPNCFRHVNYYLTYLLHSQLVFLMSWWSDSSCVLYCDPNDLKYFGKEAMFVLLNHTYPIDWMFGWLFCDHVGILGNSKIVSKKLWQYIPILGWSWKLQENIFLDRDWQKDKINLGLQVDKLAQYKKPYLITLLPEGTRFTKEKHEVSMQVAKAKGLPPLKHLLLPRTRGFVSTLTHLRKSIPAIYDATVAFKEQLNEPTLENILGGKRIVGHMVMRRIPISEIPRDNKMAADWLQQLYREKDLLLDNFLANGDFNYNGQLKQFKNYDYVELPKKKTSLRCFVVVFCLVNFTVGFWFYLNFMSGNYEKCGVVFSLLGIVYLGMNQISNLMKVDKVSKYGSEWTHGDGFNCDQEKKLTEEKCE